MTTNRNRAIGALIAIGASVVLWAFLVAVGFAWTYDYWTATP